MDEENEAGGGQQQNQNNKSGRGKPLDSARDRVQNFQKGTDKLSKGLGNSSKKIATKGRKKFC